MIESPLCVLVDDDEIVRDSWQLDFSIENKPFIAFESIKKFQEWFDQNEPSLNKKTHFCFDLNIEGKKLSFDGIELAKAVFSKGFQSVHICSLVEPAEVEDKLTQGINYQQSKEPPREILL